MKFTTNKKLFLLTLSLTLLYFSNPLKLKLSQTGVEQQGLAMNIFNNSTQFISSNDINIKLIQIQQDIDGQNKYVGYWQMSIKDSHKNITPHGFLEEVPNFGRLVDSQTVNVDFRYIQGCNFDVKEESTNMKVTFQMISKESTSQHVYTIEFILNSAGNKQEEIKKYFENVQKICKSTQETANLMKGKLAEILKENLAIKRNKGSKKVKLPGENTKGAKNSTDPSPVASPGNPAVNQTKLDINLDDIEDPNVKNVIKHLQNILKNEGDNLKKNQHRKDRLIKRANELMDRLDKDNQVLSVSEPKNEEYQKNSKSANLTVTQGHGAINNLTHTNKLLNLSLTMVSNNKTVQDGKVKSLTDEFNNIKADLNKNIEDERVIKKAIADIEAKAAVDTETLETIEDKKKELLSKIKDLNSEIKKDGDDIESNGNNLELIQTNANNLEQESKKIQKHVEELKKKLAGLMKKENDIKKLIDPKHISTMDTQKQTTMTGLSDLEKTIAEKKAAILKIIDPQWGAILEKGFNEIVNKDNFDPQSYKKILKQIPGFVWKMPA